MKAYYSQYDEKNLTEQMKYPYRLGKAKAPSERKIKRYKDRSLKSFNVVSCLIALCVNPVCFADTMAYLGKSVLGQFFLPQVLEDLHIKNIPVKHVDNKLDEAVPFRADKISIYMDFINFWLRPLSMLMKRYNGFQGAKLAAEFMRYLRLTYNEAHKLYSVCFTTTYRPASDDRRVKSMRGADPHFECVPSLHIAIICLCFSFYKMLFEREHFTEEEKDRWYRELYDYAVEIGESVLYLKQHSVNCIPAAIYMMTKIAPELIKPEEAVGFISHLFENADDVKNEDRKKILDHIQFIYERFLLEGALEDDWTVPVIRWLNEYEPYYPFYADTAVLTKREPPRKA